MNQNNQHENLARLGEELLNEFESAEIAPIPTGFDREWQSALRRKKKQPVLRVIRWTATAAVLAFALVGVLTVAALSIDSLRKPLLEYAAQRFEQEEEIRLEEPEQFSEYQRISYVDMENVVLSVYYDGLENYQLLWADEMGQRTYNFCSPELDEEFFWDLGEQFMSAEE